MRQHPSSLSERDPEYDDHRVLTTPIAFVGLVAILSLALALLGGVITLGDVARLAGRGPGTIRIANLLESDVIVTFNRPGSPIDFEEMIVGGDVRTYPGRPVSPVVVVVRDDGGGALGTCELEVAGNGDYTFVIFPHGIALAQSDDDTTSGAELLVDHSPLCARPAT